jgi:TetR/AcrR family transcriptional regulator, transcriptional repressor for nem operon
VIYLTARWFDDPRLSRTRYALFNAIDDGRPRPWSLISRLRQDEDMLTDDGRSALRRFTVEIGQMFARATKRTRVVNELGVQADTEAIVTPLVAIVDNAASITMAGQGFQSLEKAYDALSSLVGLKDKPSRR